jgi:tetratricopeptide (TPR) repeat protein
MEAGAYSQAENEYRQAIRLDPEAATLHYGLGLLLQRTNRNQEAGREYREALRLNPNFAEAHTGLGSILSAGGRKDQAQAVNEYKQALELKTDLTAARHDLALLYVKLKNDPAAIELWRENLRRAPEFLESRLSLADTYSRTGKFDDAIEQYKAVLNDHPDYAAAIRALYEAQGDQAASKGQKQAAADQYQRALSLTVDEDDRSRLKKKLKQVKSRV